MVELRVHEDDIPLPDVKYAAKLTSEEQPGLSVEEHCRIAGLVAQAILQRMPSAVSRLIPQGAAALVALHDIGKINPCFQRHIYDASTSALPAGLKPYHPSHYQNKSAPHAQVSEDTIAHWLNSRPDAKKLREWAIVAGAHHGSRRQGEPAPEAACNGIYGGKTWLNERWALIEQLTRDFGGIPKRRPAREDIWLATGLTCVADWIASDEKWFDWKGIPGGGESEASCRVGAQRGWLGLADGASWFELWRAVRWELALSDAGASLRGRPGAGAVYH